METVMLFLLIGLLTCILVTLLRVKAGDLYVKRKRKIKTFPSDQSFRGRRN